MSLLVLDKWVEKRLRAQRKAWGVDHHDEVWDGVYIMSPLADLEHQGLIAALTAAFHQVVAMPGLGNVYPGANVSDRIEGWKKTYRAPDVVVILQDGGVREMGAFVTGPIDFLVEIVSRGDRSRKKLPFYSKIGVREVLFVERKPWRLRLYRHDGNTLQLVGTCEADVTAPLTSEVLPFSFWLTAAEPRPALLLTHTTDGRTWQA
jgi:hypothetical protein